MDIYFDNAATTKPCDEAVAAAAYMMTECFGNPSSTHAPGRLAAEKLCEARSDVAAALGGKANEVYFTSGGTESDNWALFSAAKHMRHKGKHIISSKVEHDAIRQSLSELSRQGYEVELLSPEADGSISVDAVKAALRSDTILVSLMMVNNETGAVTDIPAVSKLLKAQKSSALLHTDAVQSFMHVPFSVKTLGADMVSVSAHKIHGLKGSGALWIRNGLRMPPYIFGGGQESGYRSGTEAMPQIAAFGAAAKAGKANLARDIAAMEALRSSIIEQLAEKLPDAQIIGGGSGHVLCLSVPGCRSEVLLNYLDARGICVSKGSACKRGGRSHVLTEMGLPSDVIDGAIRLSFSRFNTLDEGEYFVEQLVNARNELFPKRK